MEIRFSKQAISEMIRRVVLAWDPDFTKVTSSEKKRMEIAEEELNNGEYYTSEDVWRDLDD